tara:strand:- start:816 stop:1685 length:870 start_codon:yes stop_codon:yes gene_type:complete
MQAYNQKSLNQRTSSCSYCGDTNHRVTDCPHAERDWTSLKQGIIPLSSVTPKSWYKSPKYWSDWYKQAETAVSKIEAARERAKQKRKPSTTPRSCGFCGSTDHTRRNCTYMQDFIAKCEKANANWRRVAYGWLVDNGLYVGSAIKVRERSWSTPKPEQIGLVTSINLDELSVMTAFNLGGYYGPVANYRQPITVTANVAGANVTLSIQNIVGPKTPIAKRAADCYTRHDYVSKMTSNAEPLDESWVTSYKQAWTWLAKKRSYEWLQDAGIVQHIDFWAAGGPAIVEITK